MAERLTLADLTKERIEEIAERQKANPPTTSSQLPRVVVCYGSVFRDQRT
mgnify:CR=1 FL=1